MKNMLKKNQMMVVALALVIAVAGYLNFTGGGLKPEKDKAEAENAVTEENLLDVSNGLFEGAEGNMDDAIISANVADSNVIDGTAEEGEDSTVDTEHIGETVLTSGAAMANMLANAKLEREQMRAKSKEVLNGIISNDTLSDEAKKDAIAAMVKLTENMEKEYNAEQQLGVKGFANAIVSISDESVDVTVPAVELTEVQRAMIEDIVMRKTGCKLEDIVITGITNEN